MDNLAERIAFWKEVAWDRTTVDARICLGPCFLFHTGLVSASAGTATAALYDGHGTSGELIMTLSGTLSLTDHRQYVPPVFFRRGLYIDVGSNVIEVVVHYLPIKE